MHLFPHIYHRFAALIMLQAILLGGELLHAQEEGEKLYVLVEDISDISPTDNCLIVAAGGEGEGNVFLMSTRQIEQQKNHWRMGTLRYAAENIPSSITTGKEEAVWHIEIVGDSAYISAPNNAMYLHRHDSPATDVCSLGFTNQRRAWCVDFSPSEHAAYFCLNKEDNRFLKTSITSQGLYVFGYYAGTQDAKVYLYRLAKNATDLPGDNAVPEDGATVAFTANTSMPLQDLAGNTWAESLPYLLASGSLATDAPTGWAKVHRKSDQLFTLYTPAGEPLGYDLRTNSEAAVWQIKNGHLASTETPVRYLLFDDRLGLYTKEEAIGASPIILRHCALPPDSATSNGIKSLSGGWSAPRLAEINWNDVDVLDLREADLPQTLGDLLSRPADRNTIVRINTTSLTGNAPQWNFTLADAEEGTLLASSTILIDSRSLPACEAEIKGASMEYTRQCLADGGWETLCLPFDTDIPDDIEAETLTQVKEDVLVFTPIQKLPAGTPAIIRCKKQSDSTVAVTFTAASSRLTTALRSDSEMHGTYTPLITQTEGEHYLLNTEGTAFVRAKTGSRLSPFRAFLMPSTAIRSIRIEHGGTTAIHPTIMKGESQRVFRIDGQRIHTEDKNISKLPAGIYIINGRKQIIHP